MNWDAIGAIGEIVGALAVVTSLIYLAVQIRQSNNLARANAHENATVHWREVSSPLLQREFAELYIQGRDNFLNMDEPDQIRFWIMFSNLLFEFETVLEKQNRGFIDESFVKPYEDYFRELMKSPGIQQYFEEKLSSHSEVLVAWIEENKA